MEENTPPSTNPLGTSTRAAAAAIYDGNTGNLQNALASMVWPLELCFDDNTTLLHYAVGLCEDAPFEDTERDMIVMIATTMANGTWLNGDARPLLARPNANGDTALHMAIRKGDAVTVSRLIRLYRQAGINLNAVTNGSGLTYAELAVDLDDLEVFKAIIAQTFNGDWTALTQRMVARQGKVLAYAIAMIMSSAYQQSTQQGTNG